MVMIDRAVRDFYGKNKKEQGIVLISCLVFLMIILGLMKLSLSSSQISNTKSGIDGDLNLSRENAQLAIRLAEEKIINVIPMGQISFCATNNASASCQDALGQAIEAVWILSDGSKTQCLKDFETSGKNNCFTSSVNFTSNDRLSIVNAAKKLNNTDGIYSYSEAQRKCPDQPLWKCIDWEKALSSSVDGAVSVEDMRKSDNKIRTDVPPLYVIEWFAPGDLDMPLDGSVLFRITGVGFGQSGGDDSNVSRAIFQANYIL